MYRNILNEPHHWQPARVILLQATSLGVLVNIILCIFQPFSLYIIAGGILKYVVLCGYGFITFLIVCITSIIFPGLFPQLYIPEQWALKKELQYAILNFILIGICNWLYSIWVFQMALSWRTFLFFQVATYSVGMLPYIIIVMANHIRLLRKNTKTAENLNSSLDEYEQNKAIIEEQPVKIVSDGGYDHFELMPSSFAFAESADNYVKIWYDEGGKLKQKMIRQTLKNIEHLFKDYSYIIRCHRTYVVNTNFITSFTGNAQGLKLTIRSENRMQVPVSRSMVPAIKSLLANRI